MDGTFGDVNIAEDDGDPTNALTNMRKMTMSEDMTPPSVGSFADGAVFTRTHMKVTDTAYVYETKDAPGPLAWNMQYPTTLTGGGVESVGAPDPSTTIQKFNIITFATDDDVSALAMRFAADSFPSEAVQEYTYHTTDEYDDIAAKDRGATDIRGQKFDGMFHGIPGEYACNDGGTAGACQATTNNQGRVVTLEGTWTFTPDNVELGMTGHMVQGVVEDTDFLTFGYWVQKNEEDDLEIGVGTFASGLALSDAYVTALANLEGTADYEGKAVGKFVMKTLAPDGAATISDGGTFTADANLTARFGGNDLSFNEQFTVIGTIDGFRNDDGDMIDPNWTVTLGKAGFATDATQGTGSPAVDRASATGFTGVASGGGPAGMWGGSFYGASPADADVPTTTANQDDYPTSIAGEFDAHFTNGHALGAFGAELD